MSGKSTITAAAIALTLALGWKSASAQTLERIEGAAQDSWRAVQDWIGVGAEEPAPDDVDFYLIERERLARHAAAIARIRERAEEISALKEEARAAPRRSLNPLVQTRADIEDDLAATLADIQGLLFTGPIEDAVAEIEALRQERRALTAEIAELREARFAAPEESVWSKTKGAIDQDIARARERIAISEREGELARAKVGARFAAIGVDLDDDQLERLLRRIDGGDILGMTALIGAISETTDVLERLMRENANSIEFAQRYFAVALVLREVVVHAQDAYLAKSDGLWLPRLAAIEADLERALREDAERRRLETSEARRAIFQRNLEHNAKALDVLRFYRERLQAQRGLVAAAREEAMRDVEAAYSTYQSVSLSSLLLGLLEEQSESLDALMDIQIPELAPIQDPELERRFEQLTLELQRSS